MVEKNKNSGASLVYVLVILSIISAFSINFVYYVEQKKDMVFLKSRKENKVEKKILVQKEKENLARIMNKGINFGGNTIFLNEKEEYFDTILKNNDGKIETEKLIFAGKDVESIGDFKVKSIKDGSGNEYFLPLEKNRVYGELEIVFGRKILDEEILFKEKISFKRVNALEVEMNISESEFL